MPVKALPIDDRWRWESVTSQPGGFVPGGFVVIKGYSNDEICDRILDISVDAQGMCLQLVNSGRIYLRKS